MRGRKFAVSPRECMFDAENRTRRKSTGYLGNNNVRSALFGGRFRMVHHQGPALRCRKSRRPPRLTWFWRSFLHAWKEVRRVSKGMTRKIEPVEKARVIWATTTFAAHFLEAAFGWCIISVLPSQHFSTDRCVGVRDVEAGTDGTHG
ncbi:hypothetical protein HPB50_020876 [Hyalomma asiaticum]|uniref:Uncharacterized protein n=1 Tax=Hyalomma asiaticum TaxID=266040 RepID=A0ACB7T897_HYAAI|nr:hypothetical protein HPB50_020876 [Hyalomma asiaticum]